MKGKSEKSQGVREMLTKSERALECHTKDLDFILCVLAGEGNDSNRLAARYKIDDFVPFKTLD